MSSTTWGAAAIVVVLLGGCARSVDEVQSLAAARQGFSTKLREKISIGEAPERPPTRVLELVDYPGPLGPMAAYVSPSPGDGRRHPAIVWLFGGFSNSIGATAWTRGPVQNDQSASGFRSAGILMMYPSMRGGNTNPGHVEACFGEVDDVLAAARFLATLEYVDPARIYLGGHSTGGTLALLVAETGTRQFRAVFSLGPADDVVGYGEEIMPFDVSNPREGELRVPVRWLAAIQLPTFVFEGASGRANVASLRALQQACGNSLVKFHAIERGDHFNIIAPLVREIGRQILEDSADAPRFDFKKVESDLMKKL